MLVSLPGGGTIQPQRPRRRQPSKGYRRLADNAVDSVEAEREGRVTLGITHRLSSPSPSGKRPAHGHSRMPATRRDHHDGPVVVPTADGGRDGSCPITPNVQIREFPAGGVIMNPEGGCLHGVMTGRILDEYQRVALPARMRFSASTIATILQDRDRFAGRHVVTVAGAACPARTIGSR